MAKEKRYCSVLDCDRDHKARGFCAKHYARWKQWGDPTISKGNGGRPTKEVSAMTRQQRVGMNIYKIPRAVKGPATRETPRTEPDTAATTTHPIRPFDDMIWFGTKPARDDEVSRLLGHLEWWQRKYASVIADQRGNWENVIKPYGEWTRGTVKEGQVDDHTLAMQAVHRLGALSHPDLDRLAGPWLKSCRTSVGLTGQDFAQLIEVERPSVARWETGTRKPAREHAKTIRLVLGDAWAYQQAGTALWLIRRQMMLNGHTDAMDTPMRELRSFVAQQLVEAEGETPVLELLSDARLGIPQGPWYDRRFDDYEDPLAWIIENEYWSPPQMAYWSVYATSVYA